MIEPNFENNLYSNDSVQFSGRGEILISVFFFIKEGAFFHGLKKFSSSLIISGEFSDEFSFFSDEFSSSDDEKMEFKLFIIFDFIFFSFKFLLSLKSLDFSFFF